MNEIMRQRSRGTAAESGRREGVEMMRSRCDMCANYEYDEEEEYYTCGVNLDEDEMYRFLSGNCSDCPYFSSDDEYSVVRHQM